VNGYAGKRERSREPVELLQLLDRVAFDAGTKALADDGVEVDEAFAAQELVDLLPPARVPAHQPLEGRGLVMPEVVDVSAGIRVERAHDAVDRRLERRALVSVCERPKTVILRRHSRCAVAPAP
jgi:hypothetical protein